LDGAESVPVEGEPEAAPDTSGSKTAEGADAEKSDTQDSAEGGEDGGEKPEEGEPKPEDEGEVVKSTEESQPEAGPVLYDWASEATFENEPQDEEKEKISIFARMKAGGEKFHERFDHFFNGGTEEQNSKRKMVCVGLAVGAVGIAVAVGTGFAVHNADMANFASQSAGRLNEVAANFHGVAATGVGAAQEAIRHAGEQMSAVQQHLAGSGDTIWAHAHSLLEQWGAKPTNTNILRLTSGIIKDNGLNWESARHMANGANFVVNIPSWIK